MAWRMSCFLSVLLIGHGCAVELQGMQEASAGSTLEELDFQNGGDEEWRALDLDGSGFLEPPEISDLGEQWKVFDYNKDGKLSKAELYIFGELLAEEHASLPTSLAELPVEEMGDLPELPETETADLTGLPTPCESLADSNEGLDMTDDPAAAAAGAHPTGSSGAEAPDASTGKLDPNTPDLGGTDIPAVEAGENDVDPLAADPLSWDPLKDAYQADQTGASSDPHPEQASAKSVNDGSQLELDDSTAAIQDAWPELPLPAVGEGGEPDQPDAADTNAVQQAEATPTVAQSDNTQPDLAAPVAEHDGAQPNEADPIGAQPDQAVQSVTVTDAETPPVQSEAKPMYKADGKMKSVGGSQLPNALLRSEK